MEWPAGLVEKMGYADTIYHTLIKFRNGDTIGQDEESSEHKIVKEWLDYLKQQARKKRHGE